ncbi:Glycoside hydrolase, family 35 [Ascosphaera apis ARSEF 7405]|uniref:Beta-galactosidase n=1 Tax=Ascosphaera apis ARSEF 7405 TaxID=392613 RepID=A0A167V776_9EURO|nr:Glycoside hydrolase, family 35 [Ascosphaera apis ARSEF 7405]
MKSFFFLAATLAALIPLSVLAAPTSNLKPSKFSYNNDTFLLNDEPYQIIGGQMDPQRIPRQYWQQRLQMARAMGLNTIFSYTFWNDIETAPGKYSFSGQNNISEYFRLAQKGGLHVVLRPGPYIDGEREWGGFPAWLSQVPGMEVRKNNSPYLNAARKYMDRLGEHLHSSQISHGGPIIMVQLENEYGSFGSDKEYLSECLKMLKDNFDIVVYTNDGGGKSYLEGGQYPGVLAETDGDPKTGYEARDKYVTDKSSLGPQLDGEYYTTWFTSWGSNSSYTTSSGDESSMQSVVDDLKYVFSTNNSISMYMFHGGTNWGFQSGSIWSGYLQAVTTSYDYGAPLDESGRPTQLYHKIRETIARYVPKNSIPAVPKTPELSSVPPFTLKPTVSLLRTLDDAKTVKAYDPVSMNALNQSFGYVLYEHRAKKKSHGVIAVGDKPRDRVLIYVNGERVGVIDNIYQYPPAITVSVNQGDLLQLIVENQGRVDYSTALEDQVKGIVGNVKIGDDVLKGWSSTSIPLDDLPRQIVPSSSTAHVTIIDDDLPVFYSGVFELPRNAKFDLSSDTFLSVPHGIKGVVWVNGVNLGRYWTIGPQQSLYLPGVYLKEMNEVVVLELEPSSNASMTAEGIATRKWFNNPDPDLKE